MTTTTVSLGYNERLQDKIDLREVIDVSRLENDVIESNEESYDSMEIYEAFLKRLEVKRNENTI